MNSKLRDAPTLRDWLTLLQTNHDKSIDEQVANIDAAEKAIRQAVAEDMLELLGDDAVITTDHTGIDLARKSAANYVLMELRQKIKEWEQPNSEVKQ